MMVANFKLAHNHDESTERTSTECGILTDIERLLELHGYETADLIHQVILPS